MAGNNQDQIEQIKYTSTEVLEQIEVPDYAVNICGYVQIIDSNQNNAQEGKKLYYKLIVSNGKKQVQVAAWGNLIPLISHVDKMRQVVFISNSKSNFAHPTYNKGNMDYELLVQQNTFAEVLGMHPEKNNEDVITQLTSFEDIKNYINDRVVLYGWVKSAFDIYTEKNNTKFLISSITDGKYKIEVKCVTIYEDLKNSIAKGSPVKITGTVEKYYNNPIILKLDFPQDYQPLPIEREDDVMSLKDLVDAYFSVENI